MMRASLVLALVLALVACSEALIHSSALPLRARSAAKNTCIKMGGHSEGEPKVATRAGKKSYKTAMFVIRSKSTLFVTWCLKNLR